ncbi:hypothetical protein Q3V94_01005 [Caloramator sp. CAR-1]|uniref:hypothetical protein n=1 Tax=Caloramator sp. CAR-1 TaxID=3062777 RepID=UPI0026E202F2|nr:hypothetical protein [Caloramator sp. CAR-1]MDO6353663.1 hypothetical protein [Caloramator sp. CAR-1]
MELILTMPNLLPSEPYAEIIYESVKKTYNNNDVKIAAEFITSFLISKIPVKITKNFLLNFVLNKLTSWTDVIKPTYVEAWGWRTYSYSEKCYIYYVTLVHYSDSSFTKPIHTSVIEVKREY